jgi:Putative prokaryotic signal transducing protein
MSSLELEPVYHAEGSSTAEVDALLIKSLLEAVGIPAVVVGDSVLPNLPFEVKVPREYVKRALKLIADRRGAAASR